MESKLTDLYDFKCEVVHHENKKPRKVTYELYRSVYMEFYKGTKTTKGAQIDLLIDRNDQVINLFEIKFYNTAFTLSKRYAWDLREKMRIFQETTKTKKQLFITFITTFGLKQNEHSLGLVEFELTLDDLFG